MVFPKSEWNNFTLLFRRFTCALLAHRTTSESSTCHPQWAFSAPPPQQFPESSAALSASLTRQTPPGLWTRPPLRMPLLSSLSGEPLLPFSHLAQGHLFLDSPPCQPYSHLHLTPSLLPSISALYKPLLHWAPSVFAILCQRVMVTLKETTTLWSPQCPQQLLCSCPLFWYPSSKFVRISRWWKKAHWGVHILLCPALVKK